MTDKELLQTMRCCREAEACLSCEAFLNCGGGVDGILDEVIDRLEGLLAENDHLREIAKMVQRWRPASEPPEDHDYYLGRVKSFVHPGRFYVNILEYDKNGFREGHIYSDDVTHWMPLPSTEGGWSECST